MITPAQQQIVAQYGQLLQQTGGELQQLMQQAGDGCKQMIAQNPADPMPLQNALGAVGQQAKTIMRKPGDGFSDFYDRIVEAGDGEPAYSQMKKMQRDFDLWAEETWERFEAGQRVDQYRAMWPKVQEAMQKPMPCNRCGAPLTRVTPHKAETVNCAACRAANQVVPEMVVGMYYSGMPHLFAQQGAFDKYYALQRFKAERETRRDAEYAATRERTEPAADAVDGTAGLGQMLDGPARLLDCRDRIVRDLDASVVARDRHDLLGQERSGSDNNGSAWHVSPSLVDRALRRGGNGRYLGRPHVARATLQGTVQV